MISKTGTKLTLKEEVEIITNAMMKAPSHKALNLLATIYVFDLSWSREAIATALHDVEVAKGWHS